MSEFTVSTHALSFFHLHCSYKALCLNVYFQFSSLLDFSFVHYFLCKFTSNIPKSKIIQILVHLSSLLPSYISRPVSFCIPLVWSQLLYVFLSPLSLETAGEIGCASILLWCFYLFILFCFVFHETNFELRSPAHVEFQTLAQWVLTRRCSEKVEARQTCTSARLTKWPHCFSNGVDFHCGSFRKMNWNRRNQLWTKRGSVLPLFFVHAKQKSRQLHSSLAGSYADLWNYGNISPSLSKK